MDIVKTQERPKYGRLIAWTMTVPGILVIAALFAMPFVFGEPNGDEAPDLVRFIGRFHPLVLHLPIGVFTLILLQEVWALVTRNKRPAGLLPIFVGAGSAVVAVVLGFLLYQGGGYEGSELVQDHLWGGIWFAAASIVTLIVKSWSMNPGASQLLYRGLLFGSFGVMGYASHDGASITHGADYLTKYAPDPIREILGLEPQEEEEVEEVKTLEDQVVYVDLVAPILELRCVECHNADKSKGRFRMDTYEHLLEGGSEGEGLEPGNGLDSNIVFRAELPEDDEEHMPPEGKKDIEDHELAILKWWIDEGADPVKTVGELAITDEIKAAIESLEITIAAGAAETESETEVVEVPPPSDELVRTVAELGEMFPGSLIFEAQNNSNLIFSAASMRTKFDDESFAQLQPVIPNLVSVNLAATAVTDRSVEMLAPAENLRMIRLSETQITDEAIDSLVEMKNLESVNLFGTAITDEGVRKLSGLPKLKSLYLWQTEVSQDVISELEEALPDLEVISGI